MKRLGLIAIATVAAGCGPPTNLLPVNDFNRPTDVAFMCFGAFPQTPDGGAPDGGAPVNGKLKVSGRPLRACHPQDQYDPGAATTTRTFAFMPNSAAGTLSVVDADHWKLLDLNVDTSGYGTAPLGQLPEQISASDDGCRIISANRGSCDLTLVDPSSLVAPTFNANYGNVDLTTDPLRGASQNFRPIKGDGTLLTAPPYEAVFLPQDTSRLLPTLPTGAQPLPIQPPQLQVCGDSAAVAPVNWPQPGSGSWYALVTYPSCDLITLVELPSGQIKSAAYVRKTTGSDGKPTVTLVDAGTSPVCSSTACAGQALAPSTGVTSDAALRSDASRNRRRARAVRAEAGVSDGAAIATDAWVARPARRGRPARVEPRAQAEPRARPELRAAPMPAPPAERRAGRSAREPVPRRPVFWAGAAGPERDRHRPRRQPCLCLAVERVVRRFGRSDETDLIAKHVERRADAAGERDLPA